MRQDLLLIALPVPSSLLRRHYLQQSLWLCPPGSAAWRWNSALAQNSKWKKNLHAQCWLWKDHTSWQKGARITEVAAKHRPQYIANCGNTDSSEWWWSKIWRCLKVAPKVFDGAHSWVELADWIPSVLAGVEDPLAVKRGICAAGHKALYSDEWGGLPDKKFLAMLHPKLTSLRDRLYSKAHDANESGGFHRKKVLSVSVTII